MNTSSFNTVSVRPTSGGVDAPRRYVRTCAAGDLVISWARGTLTLTHPDLDPAGNRGETTTTLELRSANLTSLTATEARFEGLLDTDPHEIVLSNVATSAPASLQAMAGKVASAIAAHQGGGRTHLSADVAATIAVTALHGPISDDAHDIAGMDEMAAIASAYSSS